MPIFTGPVQRLSWVELGIVINLENLRRYAETFEQMLNKETTAFEERIEQTALTIPEEERFDFYDFHSDEHWQLLEIFPDIMRKSLFINCYSYLESKIFNLCDHIYEKLGCSKPLSQITKHKGIFKAQYYFKNVAKVYFPDDSKVWEDILNYNLIRNCIVHNDSELKAKKDKVEKVSKFINNKSSIIIEKNKIKIIHEDFSLEFINTIDDFFALLLKQIP